MDGSFDVSVVIPTYNRAEMLRAALDSVLAQSVPARQIVVVDDGSTDATPDVVAEATSRAGGTEVLYLRGEHLSRLGAARNRGVAASSGSWVAFLDSDDLWKPDRLERQLEALAGTPGTGFAFCNLQRFTDAGPFGGGPYLRSDADYNGHILGDLLEEPLAVSSTLMFKREAFERVGGMADRKVSEDHEFTLRLAADYPASYVPEVLVLMREHEGRWSHAHSERAMLDYLEIVEGFLASRPQLAPEVRARGRRGMANVHLKLAWLYMEAGDRAAASRHLLAQMRLHPLDRRALSTGLRLLGPLPAQSGA